jgi:cyanophycin synthetase
VKAGYRYGLRQAVIKLSLNLQIPTDFSVNLVDEWINSALEAKAQTYKILLLDNIHIDERCLNFFSRLFLITTVLLQDVKVPVFERVAIQAVRYSGPDDNDLAVDFWFSEIGFSTQVLEAWLGAAHLLLRRICETSGDHVAMSSAAESLHQKYFVPWQNKMPGGKSSIPILQAAFELEIPFTACGGGRQLIGWGSKSRIFDRSSNSHDSAIGAQVSHRKDLALQLMRLAGVPVPIGVVINRQSPAIIRHVKHPPPWVVKPVDKDRGEGVMLGIQDFASLENAIDQTLKLSVAALVEEYVSGTCHRILVVEGRVVFVVKRNPRSVQGDGKHSVRELVTIQNEIIAKKIPIKRLPEIVLDDLTTTCLAQIGLSEVSIPAVDQKVALRPAHSSLWGGEPEVLTDQIHPANAEIALRAAKLFGLTCVGVDFISTDIAKPWYENGAVINEVNYAPVMGRTHEYQRSGAKAYLEAVFPDQGRIPIEVFLGA